MQIDNEQAAHPIEYTEASESRSSLVAGVMQGFFATAHGPQGEVTFIGTHGIGPCVGVGIVTKINGEEFPRVKVGHIDGLTEIDNSISWLLRQNKHRDGITEVYLVNGQQSSDNAVIRVAQAVAKYGLKPKHDVELNSVKTLIIDLGTGLPIASEGMGLTKWLEPNKEKYATLFQFLRMKCTHTTQFVLPMQFDLANGIPSDYEVHQLNQNLNHIQIKQLKRPPSFTFDVNRVMELLSRTSPKS
jgi:hypothetical protein